MDDLIYLDHNATTPLAEEALTAMLPFLRDQYANASSQHRAGQAARRAVETARQQVAQLIAASAHEIVFTSGATEGINLALKGLVAQHPERRHLISTPTEHKAVLDVLDYLATLGCEITLLPVQSDGLLDPQALAEALRPDTLLVSVMHVNNETGVIQPVAELARLAHAAGAYVMSDATQSVGKMPLDVSDLDVDLMAFSGHKFYGPKGVGALYLRSRRPFRVRLQAQVHGGGHERDLRSGTLNVPGIVGLGAAAALAQTRMQADAPRIGALRDQLEAALLALPGVARNGHPTQRMYNVSNLRFEGLDADALMMGLPQLAMANGSACTSRLVQPSHVLRAMGLSDAAAYGSLRLSLGRGNTPAQIERVTAELPAAVARLRAMQA